MDHRSSNHQLIRVIHDATGKRSLYVVAREPGHAPWERAEGEGDLCQLQPVTPVKTGKFTGTPWIVANGQLKGLSPQGRADGFWEEDFNVRAEGMWS